MLMTAIIFISLAGLFYTIAVMAEKAQRILRHWHVALFWLGFVCDTIGTTTMGKIAGGIQANFHGITGIIALLLMIVHTIWATWVLTSKNHRLQLSFHKFSVIVWAIWLIPMASGLLFGMAQVD
ncbi:HsmA family protein [Azotosporobacter soli]|uniref:HsmA family protein n=1 Tax=Azotosporobacter soli TaxID=3055040 RepID=UPI0031FE5176